MPGTIYTRHTYYIDWERQAPGSLILVAFFLTSLPPLSLPPAVPPSPPFLPPPSPALLVVMLRLATVSFPFAAVSFRLGDRHNRPAELMAKFLDLKLKGEKGMSDDDVENVLDKVMVLFR